VLVTTPSSDSKNPPTAQLLAAKTRKRLGEILTFDCDSLRLSHALSHPVGMSPNSMPAKRLQRLTTYYLAALYGVVGLTGGSLHYLATDWSGFWSRPDAVETVVYFHVHAPDHHGHFHRHTINEHHHAHATIAADRGEVQSKGPTAESSDSQAHKPHDCALLSLVSTLKLLDAGDCSSPIVLDSIVTVAYQPGLLFVPDVVFDSPARGPPCNYFA
jgi:hypothetical protein